MAFLLSTVCLLSFHCPLSPFAAEDSDTVPDASQPDASSDAEAWTNRTAEDVLKRMRCAAENENLALYVWNTDTLEQDEEAEDIFALVNRKNGYIWWSSPINAAGDKIATRVLSKELQSALVLTYAEPENRSSTKHRSGDSTKCTVTSRDMENGVEVTYFFRKAGIRIPVSYTLYEDYLEVSIDSRSITEKFGKEDPDSKKYILTQSLSMLNAFGAADSEETGYFVIPDGCGALIHFNNRKYSAKTYSQLIYGADTTAVPQTKGPTVEGVSLPMYGICKGENAMLAIAAGGDGNCMLNADVSGTGQSNTEYNRCYFQFVLRAPDSYYLGGDSINALDIYEKNIEPVDIAVRYYPLCSEDAVNADHSKELDTVDIAAKYREYLLSECGVVPTAKPDSTTLCVDIYGGCMKQKNILGFPVSMKTCMTSYTDTQNILEQLKANGVSDLTLTLHQWTDAGISGKVDYKAKPSAVLGGAEDFDQLKTYLETQKIDFYPSVSNTAFYSGNGYYALRDTAVRVSGAFARIVDYERAYGVPYSDKKPMSLLSPSTFDALYKKLSENARKNGLSAVAVGALSSSLYGDYDKKSTVTREQAKSQVANSLSCLHSNVGQILSEDPNAYVLPYTDIITDMPLSSSGFNLFDADVPLYQMVMHGVIPYSAKAVNASADPTELLLRSAATGSNLSFDFLHADISKLKDTDFDVYYYANDANWIRSAAEYYLFLKDILTAVSDSYIISYREDENTILTRYANGIEILTDLDAAAVTLQGKTYALSDYHTEGDAGLGGIIHQQTP